MTVLRNESPPLRHVLPVLAKNHAANGNLAYPVLGGEDALADARRISSSDLSHGRLGEFRAAVPLAPYRNAVPLLDLPDFLGRKARYPLPVATCHDEIHRPRGYPELSCQIT